MKGPWHDDTHIMNVPVSGNNYWNEDALWPYYICAYHISDRDGRIYERIYCILNFDMWMIDTFKLCT